MSQQVSKLVESRAFGHGSNAEHWLELFNNYRCYYCDVSMYRTAIKGSGGNNRDPDGLGRFKTYDHLKKRMNSGKNSLQNLRACCELCNNFRETKEVVEKVGHCHKRFKLFVEAEIKPIRHDRKAILQKFPRTGGLLQFRKELCGPVIFVEEAGASFLTCWENENGGRVQLVKEQELVLERKTSIFSRLRLLWSRMLSVVTGSMKERFSVFSK